MNNCIKSIAGTFVVAIVMLLSCTAEGILYEKGNSSVSVITITTQPATTTNVTAGSIAATLTVSASVTQSATLSYQWYNNTTNSNAGGSAITGATNASFSIPATLAVGTYYYFCEVSATGGAAPVRTSVATVNVSAASGALPALTTNAITNITATAATFGGNITNAGTPAYTERGVVYAATQNPTTANNKTVITGTGTGIFSTNITGLSGNTTYYVRAYAINTAGTAYGTQVSFTTSAISPTVTTNAVADITSTTATLGGNITNTGTPVYTERGVVYATTQNPTTANNKTVITGTGTGIFTTGVINLTANTTYYVRAYATNTVGTAYGNQVNFTTNAATVLNLSDSTINAIYTAGNYQFNINSNASWTIISNQSWCAVQPASGSGNMGITVTVTENTGATSRTAQLTITAGKESKQVTLKQDIKGSPVFDNSIVAATSFGGGDGSQGTPYLIYNAQHLKKLVDDVNKGNSYSGKYFKLTVEVQVTANEWIPIGNESYTFNGIFDGNGYRITGTMTSGKYVYYGFFGNIGQGCHISNLTIAATVNNGSTASVSTMWGKSTGAITGAIAGYIDERDIIINNCSVTGAVTGATDSNNGNFTGGVIGLIGIYEKSVVIQNCNVSGNITGGMGDGTECETGGIVGKNYSTITNCTVSSKVTGGRSQSVPGTGGIVGMNWGTITNCTVSSSGMITSDINSGHTGGIVGTVEGGNISNCTNNASVTSGNTWNTGGLIGYNAQVGVIHTSLNTGDISGAVGETGGLVGYNPAGGVYSCCTNRGKVNGQAANANNQIGSGKAVENCPNGDPKR